MIRILYTDISGAGEELYRKMYEAASPERKQRSEGLLRQEDRLRCVAAEALLKAALGTSCFRTGVSEFGKPYVSDHPGFFFNLSHSGRYVVLAYGDTEVGVDVQQHTDGNWEALARRWLAPDEQAWVRSGEEDARKRFFEIWTAKESYVKFLGKGLHMDLRSFSVLAPPPGVCYFRHDLGTDYSLSLCSTQAECTPERINLQQLG